jgi:hypothetical protein
MIRFEDYDEPGLGEHVDDMIKICEWGEDLSSQVVSYSLLGHGVKDFTGTLAIVQDMVEYAMKNTLPHFWLYDNPLWTLWQSAARLENPNPKLIALSAEAMNAIQKDPKTWVEKGKKDRLVRKNDDTVATPVGHHLGLCYTYSKRIEIPEIVQEYLDRAIKANNDEFLEAYLLYNVTSLFEYGLYRIAVEGLKPLAGYKSEKIHQMIINLLVRIRDHDPEYVEDILLRGDFPQDIVDRVLANPTSERMTNLLNYQLSNVIDDFFILGPKTMRKEFKWLFTKALDLSTFEEFASLVIREMLNIVLGEAVFNVPADAPSRQSEKGVETI